MRENLDSVEQIRGVVDSVWCLFDPNDDGSIDTDEFVVRVP